MTTIYIIRHGYAEPGAGKDDALRDLTAEGVQYIRMTAQMLKRMSITPGRILCSPRNRAQQTAQIIADVFDQQPLVREAINFQFSPATIPPLLTEFPGENLMFVGHQPSVSHVIGQMCGAQTAIAPGSVACIDLVDHGLLQGELRWLLTPSMVAALSG
jgi:phosphohistidine phosphatase